MGITYQRVEPDDADRLLAFLTGDTWPYHGAPVVTPDLARRWIAAGRYYGDESRAFWITLDGADAGLIRLMDLGDSTPVFDLRLRARCRGQGIGGQALRWLTAYLFTEFPAIRRVEGTTRQDNRAMRRAFQRAGYVKEAHYREAWPVDGGEVYDAVGYAVLRRDWLAGTTTTPEWHDEHILTGDISPAVRARPEVRRLMSIAVVASADPDLVLGQAGDLLAGDPVAHNVVGTKLADAVCYGEAGRYWIGLRAGTPAGVAAAQPADAPLAVAPMPADLVRAVAAAIDADGVGLPGVFGPAETASRFAGLWAAQRTTTATITAEERVYEVRELRFPAGVRGTRRRAAAADLELLLSWLPGFESGANWASSNPAAVFVSRRLAAGDVWIWDDDGPVSMAARTEAVAGVARIQAVNTPPEQRGRGYASAGVAALSASVLGQGSRCVLTANVTNAAANSVYQRLGYQAVSDVRRYRFS